MNKIKNNGRRIEREGNMRDKLLYMVMQKDQVIEKDQRKCPCLAKTTIYEGFKNIIEN